MVDYPLSDEQCAYAWQLVNKCNFGKRGKFDGNKERQYTGILGQVAVADLLEYPRPTAGDTWDHGIDFIVGDKKIDLKTMMRNGPTRLSMVSNLSGLQVEQGETGVYLFSSINRTNRVLTIIGWLKKIELDRKMFLPQGTPRRRQDGTTFELWCDTYEVPNRAMHEWTSPDRFIMDMQMFGL